MNFKMEERNENLSFDDKFRFKNLPDESTPKSAENMNVALDNTSWLKHNLNADNAGAHNCIFRGKNITNYLDDGSLWTRISSGTFDDLFVGDYFFKGSVGYRIAGFDYYLNKGNTQFTKHHAVIIPDINMVNAKMNDTQDTAGGYKSTNMVSTTLPTLLTTIEEVFGNTHVLEYKNMLTNAVDKTRYNRYGTNTGASSGSEWVTRKLDLMNEIQVFGSITWSSSGYDTGSMNTQLPLFKLAPEFICNRQWYWLRDVASGTRFTTVVDDGRVAQDSASAIGGVRPFFFIG